MEIRYRDRDYDRGRQNYGQRSASEYRRSYGERGQQRYRYDDSDLENQRYGREYDRESYPSQRRYQTREGYGGEEFGGGRTYSREFDRGYSDVDRYGRSYDDDWQNRSAWGDYSQRYNYPSGYRSGQSYRESSDYQRGDYGRGEYDRGQRGWWDRTSDEVASWFGDEEAERRRMMDRRREQFRGRGPKGYRRSDERIREDVNDRLSDDNWLDASDIEVAVSETVVTLTGAVSTREDKRRAEDIAEGVSGVSNVENRLRITQSSLDRSNVLGTSGTSSTTTTGAARSRTAGT